jgi:dodecin
MKQDNPLTTVRPRIPGHSPRVRASHKEHPMSVAKIIEISTESPKSFEDAIQNGIARASRTVHNIKSAWVKEQHVVVENGRVSLYRVDLKVTFVLD